MTQRPTRGSLVFKAIVLTAISAVIAVSTAQTSSSGSTATRVAVATGGTIPVRDALVVSKCGACHVPDAAGNLESISQARATPEEWQRVLRRMIARQGVSLTPDEARHVIRYLSDSHGFAPEEAKPIRYEAERRVYEETTIPNNSLRNACAKCHAFAVSLAWRRTGAEWQRFIASHASRNLFPPNQDAVSYLSKSAPLQTPEWSLWEAQNRTPNVVGRWLMTASFPGRGKYVGYLDISAAGQDEFVTEAHLTSVTSGATLVRRGRGLVYARYAWRGRSGTTTPGSAPDDLSSEAREVLWLAPDYASAEGRWFWGQYQEFGFDVHLERPTSKPSLLALNPSALRIGSRGMRIHLAGSSLPADVRPSDIDLGPGITVQHVVSDTSAGIDVEVDVVDDGKSGRRDVRVRGSVLHDALAIYDQIDYVKVTPESAVAAFADRTHVRGYVPFYAIGYQRGPDGRPHTADDIELGPIEATWSFEVFHASPDARPDVVGSVSPAGLFTPAAQNPGNNYDCWAIASIEGLRSRTGAKLEGKAYLVVTVPIYTFNGRRYVRDLNRWVDDGPVSDAP